MMHRRATPDHHHDHEHAHGHARPGWRPNLWLWTLAALAAWAATGIYVVQPNERAVVWRCGRILPEPSLPGIHCGLPWGIDRVTRLKVNEQKRVGIGLSLEDRNLGRAVDPRRAECLAGDRNLIAISAIVQYDILDAKAYLIRTADVSLAIENLATAELSAAIACRDVDDILTLGRLEIQQQVLAALKARLAQWEGEGRGLGVQINSVTLETVRPPQEVDEAFRDVISAREDRQRVVNEAQGFAAALLPSARGEAERIRLEAQGSAAETIERARGEADRFNRIVAQLASGREVTAERLILETLEEVLPRIEENRAWTTRPKSKSIWASSKTNNILWCGVPSGTQVYAAPQQRILMSIKRIAVPTMLVLVLVAVALAPRQRPIAPHAGRGRQPAVPGRPAGRRPGLPGDPCRYAPILLRVDAIADRRRGLRRQPAGIGGGHERVCRQPRRRTLARSGRTRRGTGLFQPQRAAAIRPAAAGRRLAGGTDRQGRYGQAAHPLRRAGIRHRRRRARVGGEKVACFSRSQFPPTMDRPKNNFPIWVACLHATCRG